MKIVYKRADGGVSIITPSDNSPRSLEEIAQKDVPTGHPYKIVDDSFVPGDRSKRNSWTIDEVELTDGVGL